MPHRSGFHSSLPNLKTWTVTEPDAPIRQALGRISVEIRSTRFTDITGPIAAWLAGVGALDGVLTVFMRHTSASLTIQENTDPDVRSDLADALDRLAPQDIDYRHSLEGPDDMPAHIKTALTDLSLTIPVIEGALDLGTWQAIYIIEHRQSPHTRTLTLAFQGSFRVEYPQ